MKKLLFVFTVFFCSMTFAETGYYWTNFGYDSKVTIVKMYQDGLVQGCIKSLDIFYKKRNSKYGSKSEPEFVDECSERVIDSTQKHVLAVAIIDKAFGYPSAENIPIGVVVKAAFSVIANGQLEIKKGNLESWIAMYSKQ